MFFSFNTGSGNTFLDISLKIKKEETTFLKVIFLLFSLLSSLFPLQS